MLIARSDGRIDGFCQYGPTEDQDNDPEQVGQIHRLYVHPARQRTGIGRSLLIASVGHLPTRRTHSDLMGARDGSGRESLLRTTGLETRRDPPDPSTYRPPLPTAPTLSSAIHGTHGLGAACRSTLGETTNRESGDVTTATALPLLTMLTALGPTWQQTHLTNLVLLCLVASSSAPEALRREIGSGVLIARWGVRRFPHGNRQSDARHLDESLVVTRGPRAAWMPGPREVHSGLSGFGIRILPQKKP